MSRNGKAAISTDRMFQASDKKPRFSAGLFASARDIGE
jgi:hypothetical protein